MSQTTLYSSLDTPNAHTVMDPPFEFPMCDFTFHRTHTPHCWYSPSFYTSTRGYKMCIGIDANGSGVDSNGEPVTGKYTSVYVHLMPGGYDDKLWWPFPGKVTITLLNKDKNNQDHLVKVIEFSKKKGCDEKFGGRVRGRDKSEFGWGDPCFVEQIELYKYIKNDCLWFKVEVVHGCHSLQH